MTNPENVPAVVWQPIFESSGKLKHHIHGPCLSLYEAGNNNNITIGLAEIAYDPPQIPMSREEWPTLKEMLDSTKRVVVLMDKGAEDGTAPLTNYAHPNGNKNDNSEDNANTTSVVVTF